MTRALHTVTSSALISGLKYILYIYFLNVSVFKSFKTIDPVTGQTASSVQ